MLKKMIEDILWVCRNVKDDPSLMAAANSLVGKYQFEHLEMIWTMLMEEGRPGDANKVATIMMITQRTKRNAQGA
jgi:hypothetical protein